MLYNKRHIYIRSPLRISFAGGGTDIDSFIDTGEEGHVVSSTIDLYNYVAVKDMFDSNVRVHHAEIETESIASRIKHNYARTALEHFGIFKGAEVILTSDVMTTGSGLGASSAMMSSLILGCSTLRDKSITGKHKLAELTCKLEAEAGTIGGRQDQYATVFGGLNSIKFSKKKIEVKKVNISRDNLNRLGERIFLIFTNIARENKIIQTALGENANHPDTKDYFREIKNLSFEFLSELQSKNFNLKKIGKLLDEGWKLKKSSNNHATNPYIDQLYGFLRKKGVIGGKILGAGGGGFLMAFTEDVKTKEKLKYELYPNFISMDIKFCSKGTEILWKNF